MRGSGGAKASPLPGCIIRIANVAILARQTPRPLSVAAVGTSVLLVATATQWLGAARMPRVLARAGFDVSVLIPKGSLAEKSRFVKRIGYIPDHATSREWVYAFAATVKATEPRLVLPCDDTALRLMMLLATSPPTDMQPQLKCNWRR